MLKKVREALVATTSTLTLSYYSKLMLLTAKASIETRRTVNNSEMMRGALMEATLPVRMSTTCVEPSSRSFSATNTAEDMVGDYKALWW